MERPRPDAVKQEAGASSEGPARPVAAADGAARVEVDDLVARVYRELRQIAHHHLRRERPGHTLQTTALVNEAYLRLAGLEQVVWRDRAHFLSIAARVMRRVLVDYALARRAQKRGAGARQVPIDEVAVQIEPRADEVVVVDQALARLEEMDARLVRVVECRYFAGLSIKETADALASSPATVKRQWAVARAWLNKELVRE